MDKRIHRALELTEDLNPASLEHAVAAFRSGKDTAEIAERWQVTEAQVYNLLARRKRVDTKPSLT